MIYIDIVDTKRNVTFSRYVYAKKLNVLKLFNKISFTNINDIVLWIKNYAGKIDSDPICPSHYF